MKRVLLLNREKYPEEFNGLKNYVGLRKEFAEKKIIEAINKYNPKLKIAEVQYTSINSIFPNYKKSKTNGLIARTIVITDNKKSLYESQGYSIVEKSGELIAYHIEEYVYISGIAANARNTFISQIVFPTMIDYAEEYIGGPNYSVANHRFCFINILEDSQSSNMILRNMASLYLMGMDYVEAFSSSLNIEDIPKSLGAFLKEYDSNYDKYYNINTKTYDGDYYRIDFNNRMLFWKTAKMISELKKSGDVMDFNGSSEKFFWMELLPITVFAYNQGYKVDYSEFDVFVNDYSGRFPKKSDKFHRCKILLHYVKKYCV